MNRMRLLVLLPSLFLIALLAVLAAGYFINQPQERAQQAPPPELQAEQQQAKQQQAEPQAKQRQAEPAQAEPQAEQPRLWQVRQIGESLHHPWGMSFLTPDTLLITERRGRLWRYDLAQGTRQEITGVPPVVARGQGGLLDVLAHQTAQAQDPHVYLCYSRSVEGGSATAIQLASLGADNRLAESRVIFTSNAVSRRPLHFGCRLVISKGHLFISIGERFTREMAQDLSLHAGAVVRLTLDGEIPADNPRIPGWAPELYTKGNRNPQGMAIHPGSGMIWITEHGPKGGDEINIIRPGINYGWPVISYGEEYSGGPVGEGLTSAPGYAQPVWVWTPSIAPCGMAFYEGDMFPELRDTILVASLKFRSLYAVQLQDGLPTSERILLEDRIGRIRDVEVAGDGSFLLLSDERSGGLYRVFR